MEGRPSPHILSAGVGTVLDEDLDAAALGAGTMPEGGGRRRRLSVQGPCQRQEEGEGGSRCRDHALGGRRSAAHSPRYTP